MRKQWLYMQDETPRIFKDKEIEAALDDGWVDTPAKFVEEETEEEDLESLEKDELLKRAREIKPGIGGNTGTKKLIEIITGEQADV